MDQNNLIDSAATIEYPAGTLTTGGSNWTAFPLSGTITSGILQVDESNEALPQAPSAAHKALIFVLEHVRHFGDGPSSRAAQRHLDAIVLGLDT